ncbi:MAG: hypothetical protein LiPW41_758 [Parcubacteria group bacterium LiPW_41]|nr:MAG: hypothetical protein LiPW41_758 [Parcubacteria group bacterium LiPW_41]
MSFVILILGLVIGLLTSLVEFFTENGVRKSFWMITFFLLFAAAITKYFGF